MVIKEDLSRNFGFILNDVARLMRTIFDRRVKALGLTRSQWWVLNHVFRNDGATQSELADVLEVEKATLGRLLDRMEAKGWIRREGHAADRRAKRVYLTEEVEPVMKTMRGAAADLRSDALGGLSAEQQEAFVDALLSIKNNLAGLESNLGRGGEARNGAVLNGASRHNGETAGNRNGAARNGVQRSSLARPPSARNGSAIKRRAG